MPKAAIPCLASGERRDLRRFLAAEEKNLSTNVSQAQGQMAERFRGDQMRGSPAHVPLGLTVARLQAPRQEEGLKYSSLNFWEAFLRLESLRVCGSVWHC